MKIFANPANPPEKRKLPYTTKTSKDDKSLPKKNPKNISDLFVVLKLLIFSSETYNL
jgi:hypothetical protein